MRKIALAVVFAAAAAPAQACFGPEITAAEKTQFLNALAAELLTSRGIGVQSVTQVSFYGLKMGDRRGMRGSCQAISAGGDVMVRYRIDTTPPSLRWQACEAVFTVEKVAESGPMDRFNATVKSESCSDRSVTVQP